ncbi:presqualene diphosphate synthase HpnD [Micromonospora narathiwatensis]|uniref:Farnesyl-diphosphate farnesyltransferase n=1 Tax=Micromonospora narathiwatensis TaxID=299146 RepID=A0A1A8ZH49_9ACTN|nr:presqualene diphosphate synthase HpnD [Micromonospora narathiwatensis]SBT43160.1 farnesyl-diphosphate farnesyltransferase [Micromonospora narathiwatensis]
MTTICDVDRAYRRCEQITRSQAANFAYGIRLLPPVKRRALSAIYATARRIDDIGDGTLPPDEKLDHLARIRAALHRLPGNDDGDPVLTALADAAVRMPIPLAAFDELIDGCAADVTGRTYDTFDDLRWYCRCVAGSIGRLSLGVFGATDPGRAEPLADALGVALQLTNILRDLVEDRVNGRIYLPAEDLDRFGCTLRLDDGRFADPPERLAELVRFQARRAAEWYDLGLRLLPLLDRRSAACTAAMAGIYRRLLARIAADPLAVTRSRVSLPGREKAWVAARALVGRSA